MYIYQYFRRAPRARAEKWKKFETDAAADLLRFDFRSYSTKLGSAFIGELLLWPRHHYFASYGINLVNAVHGTEPQVLGKIPDRTSSGPFVFVELVILFSEFYR